MSKERIFMFINKSADELNNICGKNIALLRKEMGISQRMLADKLQLSGLDVDKNAIQRIECGKRFVKIAFVGLDKKSKRRLKNELKGKGFVVNFLEGLEDAKQWLL